MPVALKRGDIILAMDGDSGEHAMMWVDGEKPVVHSVESKNTVGVIQQSSEYLVSAWKEKGRWIDDKEEWDPPYRVYRSNTGLGGVAADFATEWATKSDDTVYVELRGKLKAKEDLSNQPVRQPRGPGGNRNITMGSPKIDDSSSSIVLDTPFSQDRLGGGDKPWDVYSLFRALRAYYRGQNRLPLSQLKGVTCSQFVTYCYQAASIHKYFGGLAIPQGLLSRISKNDKLYSLKKDNGSADLIKEALNGINIAQIPKAMLVDAKTTSAECLQENLEAADSGFSHMGSLSPSVEIILSMENVFLRTFGDVKKLCRIQ